MDTHTCVHCHDTKPVSEFPRDKNRLNGLHPYCKACRNAANKRSYQRHRKQTLMRQQALQRAKRDAKDPEFLAKRREYQRQWRESHPGEDAATVRRSQQRHATRVKAYRKAKRAVMTPEERAAERARLRAYKASHPAHVRGVHTAWRQSHKTRITDYARKRRAQKRAAPAITLTAAQWQQIKEVFDHRCAYCHRQMQRLEQDHVTPLAKGGTHTMQNVVPACRTCNAKKGTGEPLIPVQPLLL